MDIFELLRNTVESDRFRDDHPWTMTINEVRPIIIWHRLLVYSYSRDSMIVTSDWCNIISRKVVASWGQAWPSIIWFYHFIYSLIKLLVCLCACFVSDKIMIWLTVQEQRAAADASCIDMHKSSSFSLTDPKSSKKCGWWLPRHSAARPLHFTWIPPMVALHHWQ